MQKQFLFAFTVAALSSAGGTSVRAADQSPPVASAPAWTWDGFYLGAQAGYARAHDPLQRQLSIPPSNLDFDDVNSRGAFGGVYAGFNRQNGRWVTGLELDVSATAIRGRSTVTGTGLAGTETLSIIDRFDMLGSGRVRLGYLPRPDLLLYATGGLAWTAATQSADDVAVFSAGGGQSTHFGQPTWQFGWVAGAGAEMRLANTNWLARLEYLHSDFVSGYSTTSTSITNGVAFNQAGSNGPITLDLVRAGLSYKFGGASAPAASAPSAWAPPLPVKAAARTSLWSWTGFYVGAHAGYGWAHDPFSEFIGSNGSGLLQNIDGRGGLGGFQAGANWQRGALVGGLEIDLSGTGIRGQHGASSTIVSPGFTDNISITLGDKVELLGSARARLGYLVSPTTLLYGTGGLAWTEVDRTQASVENITAAGFPDVVTTNMSTPFWRFGWVAGFGAEQRIGATNWTARLEYLHYDFGGFVNSFVTSTTGGVTTVTTGLTSGHTTVDVVRAGANYMFGSPDGAPAARIDEARPAPANWNGFYLGLHGGGGFGNDPFSETGPAELLRPDVHSAGWLAGGHAGANWQTDRWLAGLEADISATGIKGSGTSPALEVFPGLFVSKTTGDTFNLLGSARARLGWLPLPNLLVYGTGGLAWAQVTQETINQTVIGGTISTGTISQVGWRWGWAAGLGAETRIGQSNWLGRIEYLHYDFGRALDQNVTTNTSASSFSEGRLTSDVLRVGFSYQLD